MFRIARKSKTILKSPGIWVCVLTVFLGISPILAKGPDTEKDSLTTDNKDKKEVTSLNHFLRNGSGLFQWSGKQYKESLTSTSTTNNAALLNKISVSGFVRFLAIYRNMDIAYSDMESSKRNISFGDYPVNLSSPVNSASSYPLLNIDIKAKPSANSTIDIGYSFIHNYSGKLSDTSKTVTARSNLNLNGSLVTKAGTFRLAAGGGVLWSSISPLTVSNPEYRDVYYERLPWDSYNNSFQRYNDYYLTSNSVGSERFGNAAMQGFILSGERLPLGLGFTAIYGRSAQSASFDRLAMQYPSLLYAGRVDKQFGPLKIGVNYYNQWGYTDRVNYIDDKTQVITGDIRFKKKGINFYTESGAGRVLNPSNTNAWGFAFMTAFDLDKSLVKIPLQLKLYSVDVNVGSLVSSSLNSNPNIVSGGYGNDPLYATAATFVNVAQEVGQIANNRTGLSLKLEKAFGKLNVNLATAISQENQNLYDTITIQHRVNAFSRSRFKPWYQAGGPYGTLKSVWMRTYENIYITDSVHDYKKGFNGLDLTLKYKFRIFNRSLIVMNYNNYNSIQEGLSAIPQFSSKAFVKTFYEEFSMFYQLSRRYTLVGFFGMERVMANTRTKLSTENGKPVDQTGRGIGFGIDYDFADNAGLYLRHRWMQHEDKNFVLDQFKGQETTIELKLFF
jgi:hypothetical protein